MTPAIIVREAQADGVSLTLSRTGTIKATGDGAAVNRWLSVIREHKAEIIEALKVGAGDTAPASCWWLIHYPDRDPLEVSCTPPATNAEILEQHPDALAAEPLTPTIRQPFAPLTASEEAAIRAWLALIEETGADVIGDVLSQCKDDAEARNYYLRRAQVDLQEGGADAAWDGDRRCCSQCANLSLRRVCVIAGPVGLDSARRSHEPIRDLPRRCEGYVPKADDPDQRPGRERWPGLSENGR